VCVLQSARCVRDLREDAQELRRKRIAESCNEQFKSNLQISVSGCAHLKDVLLDQSTGGDVLSRRLWQAEAKDLLASHVPLLSAQNRPDAQRQQSLSELEGTKHAEEHQRQIDQASTIIRKNRHNKTLNASLKEKRYGEAGALQGQASKVDAVIARPFRCWNDVVMQKCVSTLLCLVLLRLASHGKKVKASRVSLWRLTRDICVRINRKVG